MTSETIVQFLAKALVDKTIHKPTQNVGSWRFWITPIDLWNLFSNTLEFIVTNTNM